MNIDTLVENFYSKIDENEDLISEVMKFLLVEGDTDKERVIRRPTIKITELWGKTQNGDREVMEALMRNISGATVKAKIDSVNDFMTATAPAEGEGDITKIMTYLIFLDTFASIVNDYGASVTGFLFEAFLAALFGGTSIQIDDPAQVDATRGTLPIEDVHLAIQRGEEEDPEIKPYSLKVLGSGGAVKGSYKNIVDYFIDPSAERRTDSIVYLIVIKEMKGKGDDRQWTGLLKFYEFVITRENFLELIGVPKMVPIYDYVPITLARKQKQRKMSAPSHLKSKKGDWPDRFKALNPENPEIPLGAPLEKGTEVLELKIVGEKEMVQGAAAKLYDTEQYKAIKKAFAGGASLDPDGNLEIDRQVFAAVKDSKGYNTKKQWIIQPSMYEKHPIGEINLDAEVMRVKAEEYSRSLNDSIVTIFNAVGDLSDNINRYFIGSKGENRKVAGLLARNDAKILKVEVDRTIDEI
jgi:hypothetical protein